MFRKLEITEMTRRTEVIIFKDPHFCEYIARQICLSFNLTASSVLVKRYQYIKMVALSPKLKSIFMISDVDGKALVDLCEHVQQNLELQSRLFAVLSIMNFLFAHGMLSKENTVQELSEILDDFIHKLNKDVRLAPKVLLLCSHARYAIKKEVEDSQGRGPGTEWSVGDLFYRLKKRAEELDRLLSFGE